MKRIALVLATSTVLALSGAAYAKSDNGQGNGQGCHPGGTDFGPGDLNAASAEFAEFLGLKNKKELAAQYFGYKNWGELLNDLCGT